MSNDNTALTRQETVGVKVGNVVIGEKAPIVVQSMTNTDTADAVSTATQVQELSKAGSELVRITVNNEEAASAVIRIREILDSKGCDVPLIGDFHYNGHTLLSKYPECAQALAKYRINPGNVGFGKKKDSQFSTMIEMAIKYNKPVRIGVNWGSLDQELFVSQKQEYDDKKELLDNGMKILNDREKKIITARRLSEEPKTLEELSKIYRISRERIRQIETKAFEKLQKSMITASKSKNLLPAN